VDAALVGRSPRRGSVDRAMTWSTSSERRRVMVCAVAGLVAAALTAVLGVWELAVLAGWVVMAVSLLVWIWLEIARLDAVTTARVATREDDSRAASRAILVGSSVVSLAAIVSALHRASSASRGMEIALTVIALVSVVVSWLMVNTMFVLRYAHLYYGGDAVGGVSIPGDGLPNYQDFTYLAFTVGMTFQVSDTAITDRAFRLTVLRQALLAYVFSIATIAFTINVVAGFV
jgi:uncharacterized membrane protein